MYTLAQRGIFLRIFLNYTASDLMVMPVDKPMGLIGQSAPGH
jgi:hypothetical protein